jgi:hypothetical protein
MSGAHAKQPKFKIKKHDPWCAVAGCERPYYAKHYCRLHWERSYFNGAPIVRVVLPGTPAAERLEFYSERSGKCLVYTGHLDRYGYGQITIDGQMRTVHRLAYELAHGPIPKGLVVRHKCDNRPCIDPDHLEVGTNKDNSEDQVKRGRTTKGSKNGEAKLTEAQVVEILAALDGGALAIHLAKEYGVGNSAIGRIRRREAWKHVGGAQ